MKKITLLTAVIISASLASCKKNWVCQCSDSNGELAFEARSQKMKKRRLLKPFDFVFENIDSSHADEKPSLPMFITETPTQANAVSLLCLGQSHHLTHEPP